VRALADHTVVDVRHPRDWAMGVVPGALRAPHGDGVAPGPRLVVLDQIGADAPAIGARLHAPWIQGGFAAWLEEGGPIEPAPRAGRHQVGDPVRFRGRDGWIQDVEADDGTAYVTLWFDDGPAAERVRGDALDA
jgi:rhodanese-related sulfurtransferase